MNVSLRGIVTPGVMTAMPSTAADSSGFVHPALFYRGPEEYVTGVGSFLRAGLAAGEPVFASVPTERLAWLRDHLDADADRVELLDMAELGRNPGRIMTALADFADGRGDGRAWLVGEPVWASRSPAEVREATRHEALINLAFVGVPVTILCPYDVLGLPPATLAQAERTHPVLRTGAREWPSSVFTNPLVVNAECDAIDPAPAKARRLVFGPPELSSARRGAKDFGRMVGMSEDRAVDFMLAVGEAAANAIRHGGGGGTLVLWHTRHDVVAEISDAGRLADPLAGRRRPDLGATNGRGLWLIHQVCDLVELGQGVIRLHLSVR